MAAAQPSVLVGMAMRAASAALLSLMFALAKLADARGVHLAESLFYRQLFSIPIICLWLVIGPGLASVSTTRIGAHIWRTIIGLSGMALNFLSMLLLPMPEATAIGFAMPIFATILAALVLKEPTGRYRWAAVIIGFVGVLIVAWPDSAALHSIGTLVAIIAAMTTAVVTITLRQLGSTEAATTTAFWFSCFSAVLLLPLVIVYGQAHDRETWAIIGALGIVGGLAQIMLTGALRLAPVAVVMPMDYTSLIWAGLFGWFIFERLPLPTTLIGAPIIIASGIAILWREHRLDKMRAASAAISP